MAKRTPLELEDFEAYGCRYLRVVDAQGRVVYQTSKSPAAAVGLAPCSGLRTATKPTTKS